MLIILDGTPALLQQMELSWQTLHGHNIWMLYTLDLNAMIESQIWIFLSMIKDIPAQELLCS